MKKFITLLSVVLFSISTFFAQVPANCGDVMLQGFMFDSVSLCSWNNLYLISGDISGNFDDVWFPPSAFSEGGTGYHPRQWSNQNSAWGNEAKLKQLINALHSNSCKAIADIVVNHRANQSGWIDFYPEDFGTYGTFNFLPSHICKDDEAVTNGYLTESQAGGYDYNWNVSGDYWGGYSAARDIDHSSTFVQNAVKAYLKWLKNEIGYDGWRYDLVKGFDPARIADYNAAGAGYLSVGEYWDGNYDKVWDWINGTNKTSMAFDFPMKYAALNSGLASGNYGNMQWLDGSTPRPAGLIHSSQSRRYSVTFVDNHDTYRDGSKYTGDVQKAYAFLMSSPGVPCVFYKHWVDNQEKINQMIMARKAAGLNSESTVTVENTSGYYKAYSVGTYGAMLTYIGGDGGETPGSGWVLECSGNGWKIYVNTTATSGATNPSDAGRIAHQNKINNGVNPIPDGPVGDITLKAVVPASWTSANVYIWEIGGAQITSNWPGNPMTAQGNSVFSYTLNNSTASEIGVVFNFCTATDTVQTVDLSTTQSTCWVLENTPTMAGKYKATVDETCTPSAINEIEANSFIIYPNPTSDYLQITNYDLQFNSVQILDIAGKVVLINHLPLTTNHSIDVSGLANGIYLIKIYTDKGIKTERFIKK
ncbi:MAG: T9SS type A sorting domain-containing protein [Prevotellaceae bacterium]|jgi:alpha-amylase|nr:T9SS type A sorting domain-containing protein [Prevotellaceae bacterium]